MPVPTGLMPLAIFGRHLFIIDNASLNSLTRVWDFNIASIDRVGQLPQKQFLGEANRTITLPGSLYPGLFGRSKFIDEVAEDARSGIPQLLITNYKGIGKVLGYWHITSCSEEAGSFDAQNLSRKIDFKISLTYYGEHYEGSKLFNSGGGLAKPYLFRLLRQL